MIFLYYAGAALLIWLSIRSLVNGVRYLRFFRIETAKVISKPRQFASVFLPCRGLDPGLEQTLTALLEQDYDDYDVLVIVDSETDPAVPTIRRILDNSAIRTQLVIAPRAISCSQKIANLLAGIERADPAADVFVFVDSDASPGSGWLAHLVSALNVPDVGAASGYRWYLPEHPTLAAEMRAAWNASIASALGPNRNGNFCWGGSMAISRRLMEQLDISRLWENAVSDDLVLTRAVKQAGLGIAHVTQAICVSGDGCSAAELMEFTTRQMKITRVYARDLWLVSLIGSAVFGLMMASSAAILMMSDNFEQKIAAAFTLVVVTLLSLAKAYLRMKAIRLSLPGHAPRLVRQTAAHLGLTMLTPFLFFINCVAALFSTTINWRGTRYQLKSPHETVIISD
jgi:ceramide glucosyltransferase